MTVADPNVFLARNVNRICNLSASMKPEQLFGKVASVFYAIPTIGVNRKHLRPELQKDVLNC
jgi:hypothetical protein